MTALDDLDPNVLWVRSDITAFGTYAVSIAAGPDRARVLSPDEALQYATVALAAAQRAEHDWAASNLLRKLGCDERSISGLLGQDIRPDRPPLHDAATTPLRFMPGCSARRPFVDIYVDGKPWGQQSVAQIRSHALTVLETIEAAHLDAALLRVLRGPIGLPENTARGVIQDLVNHRGYDPKADE